MRDYYSRNVGALGHGYLCIRIQKERHERARGAVSAPCRGSSRGEAFQEAFGESAEGRHP